ncbi:hypothetical protein G5I_02554 [Acromyrmex echinatior]|uniref:Uncharacterized protein n=1 Tax=Acromyrmex echinatior TaxID=103372 RepID=F4WAL6_ACREC|nr:hypothetical protein G5I_02554 [Acromyrmex echinatior]
MPILRTRLEYNGNVKSEDLKVLTAVNAEKRASVMSSLHDDQQNTILPLLMDFYFIHSLLGHVGFSRPSAESPVVRVGYLGHKDVWEVFIRHRTGEGVKEEDYSASRKGKKKQEALVCTPRDILERVDGVYSSLIKPKETERERGRAPSIFASLFQAEAG